MIFDPQAIEAELEQVQKENAPGAARACLLNIVAFSDDSSQMAVEGILDYALGRRAARVIRVVASNEDESSISVSARCKLDHNRESVCLQEIIVEDGADRIGRAPTTWTSLLVRDIPVYILWLRSVVGESQLLAEVSQYADIVVIDIDDCVRRGDSIAATVASLYALGIGRSSAAERVVSDLAWLRLETLRHLVAQMYDSDEALPLLDNIAAVRLKGLSSVEALLFQSWLAERLGWTAGEGGWRDRQLRTPKIEVSAAPYGIAAKEKPWVEISHYDGDTACVEVDSGNCAHVDAPGRKRETQLATISGSPELFLHEIDAARQDTLYYRALETLFPPQTP